MPQAADPKLVPKYTLRLTRPLVLVGLMGAGKTSVGRRLADFLKVPFQDSDVEIEAAAGLEVREIFERFGEAYFRDGERRVIARLLGEAPGVLATGGGAFVSADIRKMVADAGLSVWLDADLETLWSRVKDRPSRPLLQRPDAKSVLAGLLETRRTAYREAAVRVVSERDLSHEVMVRRILEAIVAYDRVHPDQVATLQKVE